MSTTQLGVIGLWRAGAKQPEKSKEYKTQYVDLMINGRLAHAMVDTGIEANIMNKSATTRLGIRYNPSNACLRTVNTPATPMCGVAQGVDIILGKCHGKTNFTVAPLDLFDIILGQKFFQRCHTVIGLYLQQLMFMEQGGSPIVPLVKVPKLERQAQLSALQLMNGFKDKKSLSCSTLMEGGIVERSQAKAMIANYNNVPCALEGTISEEDHMGTIGRPVVVRR